MIAPQLTEKLINTIPAMVAYWDVNQKCRYCNSAYRVWFGIEPQRIIGMQLQQLLGEIYQENLKYIEGALAGVRQSFERRIRSSDGTVRDSITTYIPEVVDGSVVGFIAFVTDVTTIRQREDAVRDRTAALLGTIEEAISVLESTKRSFRSNELASLRTRLTHIHRSMAAS